jgi:muramoyltetrapeptide carboxypeptidase
LSKSRTPRTHPLSVGFFAPSGFLPDASIIDRAAQCFAERGWRVSAGDSVFARHQRFAGPDELRAAELQRFATDKSLDVAISARGGYGLTRLLDRFDFGAIADSGVALVGYSDFTIVNLALLAKTGTVSFQGPAASDFAGAVDAGGPAKPEAREAAQFTVGHFFAAMSNDPYEVHFAADISGPADLEVSGRLWGGNLAMVCSLLGTPYFPKVRGGILFLEDVNEPVYRIERMLLQLHHAGVLDQQKAVILGEFAPITPMPNDEGYDLAAAWEAVHQRCDVPLVRGLPFGHGRRRLTLAVGARAKLALHAGRATLQFTGHPTIAA